MLVSSALFARSVDRGNAFWWALYALSAVLLPLTHPIAVSALAAHLVAAAFAWRQLDLRLALPAIAIAVVECGLLLVAAALDRADALDGAGPLQLGDVGAGDRSRACLEPGGRGVGALGDRLAVPRLDGPAPGRWKAALVAGLAVMPLVFVLAAGVVVPVSPRAASTVAAGAGPCARRRHRPRRHHRPRRAPRGRSGPRGRRGRGARDGGGPRTSRRTGRRGGAARPGRTRVRNGHRGRPSGAGASGVLLRRTRAPCSPTVGRGDAVFVVIAGDSGPQATASGRRVVSPPPYRAPLRGARGRRSRRPSAGSGPAGHHVDPRRRAQVDQHAVPQRGRRASHTRRPCQIRRCGKRAQSARGTTR